MRTRIAPTPSGFLHVGNLANALLTHWWAQAEGGTTLLRIDDVDAPRVRREYIEDIHGLLAWLQIPVAIDGDSITSPSAAPDRYSRIALARSALDTALRKGMPAYACTCSRSRLTDIPRGGCPGGCRRAGHSLEPGSSALRLVVEPGTLVGTDDSAVDLAEAMGDFVVWRRDDLPAYQWISVVEDTHHKITHILRGADLRESSAAQIHLAQYLEDPRFMDVQIRHHGLVTDASGVKLSKSQLGAETGLARTEDLRRHVHGHARSLGEAIGLPVG